MSAAGTRRRSASFGREHPRERCFAAGAIGHGDQLGPDDGNHPAFIDELEQIVPEEILDSFGDSRHFWRKRRRQSAS